VIIPKPLLEQAGLTKDVDARPAKASTTSDVARTSAPSITNAPRDDERAWQRLRLRSMEQLLQPPIRSGVPLTRRSRPFYHCFNMKTSLQRIGNSRGVIIPKPLLGQAGLTKDVEMSVERGAIVLRPASAVRAGWAEDSARIAAAGDDALVWPEFANDEDSTLVW